MYFSEKEIKSKETIEMPIYVMIILFSAQNLLFYLYWSDLYNYIQGLF